MLIAFMVCSAANAKDYTEIADMEAGTESALAVANDPVVLKMVETLSQQKTLSEETPVACSLEKLDSTVSEPQVLVGFFVENNAAGVAVNKFVVGIKCKGSEQVGDVRYDLVVIRGDGGNLIESLTLN